MHDLQVCFVEYKERVFTLKTLNSGNCSRTEFTFLKALLLSSWYVGVFLQSLILLKHRIRRFNLSLTFPLLSFSYLRTSHQT
jgi:hypothetical protein